MEFSEEEKQQSKRVALLAYLGPLCLVPLLQKKSAYARFHGEQGARLLAFWLVLGILVRHLSCVPYVGAFARLLHLLPVSLMLLGIIHVIRMEAKELPLVGKILRK